VKAMVMPIPVTKIGLPNLTVIFPHPRQLL
jgi:hypothetical protein